MATAVGRNRAASPAPWEAALRRAISDALDVLIEPVSGEVFVESATQPGVLYRVSRERCTCLAGQHGLACKHRAALLAQLGELSLPETNEVSLTPAAVDCPTCFGKGFTYAETAGGQGWPDQVACHRCGGTGKVAVAIIRHVGPTASLSAAAD